MAGSITTGINFNIDSLKEIDSIADDLKLSRSRFVQIACRNQIKLHRKQSVRQYLDSLNDKELSVLKDIIKKGA